MKEIDPTKFRKVLGHFPTGVTIITSTTSEGAPKGLVVGAFSSLSLNPPLVLFCPDKSSQSWPEIKETGHFCVNVLNYNQSKVSGIFATKEKNKFVGLEWSTEKTGAPVLKDVLCWIDCEIENIYEAGDHWIVVGKVLDLGINSEIAESTGPLIFYKGTYGKIVSLG